jgi:hypothetical protein
MAHEITAEDSERDIVAKMGEALGLTFSALYREVVLLHAKWQEYRALFGSDAERVALLNRSAGFFFKIVQDGLWEDVLLHIARLTDPPRSAGRRNLTVQMLPPLIAQEKLRAHAEELLKICIEKAEFAREHRNRRLAHLDLLHATAPAAVPLTGISRAHVEDMLRSLRDLMNAIDGHFRDTMVIYEQFISYSGAENLVAILRRAERANSGTDALR